MECGMMTAAIHQLSQHIDVPNYCSSGLSDSKLPDTQSGWEKANSLSARARAVNMAKTILEHPIPAAIDPDIEDRIRKEFKIYFTI